MTVAELAHQPVHTKASRGVPMMIIGMIFMAAGVSFIALPRAGLVLHPDGAGWGVFPEWVSDERSRVYGAVAVLLGAGLVWLARWPKWGARRTAIEDYVWSLSQELMRRFGEKKYYRVEEVSRIAGEGGYSIAYLAYAHAMFCSRTDFNAHYDPLHVACTYDGLRDVVARRYLDGGWGFDAKTIVRLATPPRDEEYDFHQGIVE